MATVASTFDRLCRVIQSNEQFTETKGLARVGAGGVFLGLTLMAGLQLVIFSPTFAQFGAYVFCISLFHWLEFFLTSLFNPHTLSFDSYLLNHSPEYHMAMGASVVEYFIESLVFPSMKAIWPVTVLGVTITLTGQTIRTWAMWQAASNFTHQIAEVKRENHQLVVDGIYRLCRHPSYCGWFWWALGTQVILINPVSIVAYALVAWRFFKERINIEENYLDEFFPDKYPNYRREVWSGIPGVDGVWFPTSLNLSSVAVALGVSAAKSDA